MNAVRSLRVLVRATQHEFARRVGTSQSTVAAYESGTKSPTLKTLSRFATSFGLEANIEFSTPMTREERRSLAFHVAIAEILDRAPESARARAQKNLAKLREMHPGARSLLDRWQLWLTLPTDDLKTLMLLTSNAAREMRQVSPFSGLLTANERARILTRFRRNAAA